MADPITHLHRCIWGAILLLLLVNAGCKSRVQHGEYALSDSSKAWLPTAQQVQYTNEQGQTVTLELESEANTFINRSFESNPGILGFGVVYDYADMEYTGKRYSNKEWVISYDLNLYLQQNKDVTELLTVNLQQAQPLATKTIDHWVGDNYDWYRDTLTAIDTLIKHGVIWTDVYGKPQGADTFYFKKQHGVVSFSLGNAEWVLLP